MSVQIERGIDTRLFVGGEWVDAEDGRTFENRDPFTDELVSEVAAGNRADAGNVVSHVRISISNVAVVVSYLSAPAGQPQRCSWKRVG